MQQFRSAAHVPWAFLQSVGFMSNTLEWARSIRAAQAVVRASTGEGRIAVIDPADIADVAVVALEES